jgi:hypothetical protein
VQTKLSFGGKDIGSNVVRKILVNFIDDLLNLAMSTGAVDKCCVLSAALLALPLDVGSDRTQKRYGFACACRGFEHSVLAAFDGIERLGNVFLLAVVELVREPDIKVVKSQLLLLSLRPI